MTPNELEHILKDYKENRLTLNDALLKLRDWPFEDMGFAKVDHHRTVRQGFPEVIYCAGKQTDQVIAIMETLIENHGRVLATRASQEMAERACRKWPDATYDSLARLIVYDPEPMPKDEARKILILTAGTSDLPVAQEAMLTAQTMGNEVELICDVGVAGLHRLLAYRQQIEEANVIIVIAGMEGALASVVGGLANKPVIAVPTSVGYGAAFGGLTALLGMLNSCAAGVAVVNIDNGFGAGRLASMINQMR